MADLDIRDSITKLFSKIEGISKSLKTFASATSSVEVVPNDDTELDFNALYIGTTGTVVIKHSASGSTVTFVNIPSAFVLPVYGVRVMAATTASNIVAMKW